MSTLIAVMTVGRVGDTQKFLRIRLGEGGELTYRLSNAAGVGYALSNLGMKKPPPAFRRDTLDQTLGDIEDWIASGYYHWQKTETAKPTKPKKDKGLCPNCGEEL